MRPSWEELNAYADGELDAARAAEIADAAAQDRGLAASIAQVMKAKSAVSSVAGGATAPASLRHRLRQDDVAAGWRRYRRPALAASLVLLLLAGGLVAARLGPSSDTPAWLNAARAVHADFIAPEETPPRALPATAFSLSGAFVLLPDLAAGELTLVGVEELSAPRGLKGVAAHYRGNRGCRLTLLALPQAPAGVESEEPSAVPGASGGALAWRNGEVAYLLLGSGMDPARFELLANKIHAAARELRLFTPEEEYALAQSRATSAPCGA